MARGAEEEPEELLRARVAHVPVGAAVASAEEDDAEVMRRALTAVADVG
jgi:hypothetical protein